MESRDVLSTLCSDDRGHNGDEYRSCTGYQEPGGLGPVLFFSRKENKGVNE